MKLKTLTVLLCLFFIGCRSSRKMQRILDVKEDPTIVAVTPGGETSREDSLQFIQSVLARVDSNRIDFNTFSGKFKLDLVEDGKKNELTVSVRIRKDSAIWLSVNAILGIEAARVLMTPDSIKVLDRLHKTAIGFKMAYLEEIVGLPVDFSTTQDIFVGNPIIGADKAEAYFPGPGTIAVLLTRETLRNLLTLSTDNYLMMSARIDEPEVKNGRGCTIIHSDYQQKSGRYFPMFRSLTFTGNIKRDVKMDFKQFGFNEPLSFPFSIPPGYSRN